MKDYFKDWGGKSGEEQSKQLQKLRSLYFAVDDWHDCRFREDSSEQQLISGNKVYEDRLAEIDKTWTMYQENDMHRKMAHLTKGNILLRMGQNYAESFQDPQTYYQHACSIMEQIYDPEGKSLLDYMLQLNLGKYFRNMGKFNQRSDLRRALDEFNQLWEKLEGQDRDRFSPYETHIWLETMVNIGRTERYLYHLTEAKTLFWSIINLLFPYSDPFLSPETTKSVLDYVPELKMKLDIWNEERERLCPSEYCRSGIYLDYLVQALVQLSAAYQKGREYREAQNICTAILQIDPANVDAANNLGVCLWKQEQESGVIPAPAHGAAASYLQKSCTEIFQELSCRGNRFAKLYYFKCKMKSKRLPQKDEALVQDIFAGYMQNPNDQELCFLWARYLKKSGEMEQSQELLKKICMKSPHISRGSIGLKAYYNAAGSLLLQKRFHEAMDYYDRIIQACKRSSFKKQEGAGTGCGESRTGRKKKMMAGLVDKLGLWELPEGDLPSEIAKGWCLLNLGKYQAAIKCCEDILQNYKDKEDLMGKGNEARVRNNLAECYLHLAAAGTQPKDSMERAQEQLLEVLRKEPYNATSNRHYGYYFILKGEYETAQMRFDKTGLYYADDIYAYSGWVSAAVTRLTKMTQPSEERSKLIQDILKKLQYSSGVYSIKTCERFASFIKLLEQEPDQQDLLTKAYRSLARIRIGSREEGYGLFQHFMENDAFRNLDAELRGKLLVVLFSLYGQVIQIKATCRFVQEKGQRLPVHYTRLSTLKKLLPDDPQAPGKLRLWNTIYMNDSFEGGCFMEMMEQVEVKRSRCSLERARKKLARYFPYLNRQPSPESSLSPINESIYVISFSEHRNAIPMWIPYADDATGSQITFTDSFFDLRTVRDTLTDVSIYSDQDYPLYRVQYLDQEDWKKWKRSASRTVSVFSSRENNIEFILNAMHEIWGRLDELENRIPETKDSKKVRETIYNFVADCLNEVRFLIKDAEYDNEKEVRMLHYSHEQNVDMENFSVPRLYVDVDREIQISEVMLGPKISEAQANEIVAWLTKTERVKSIKRSERHYK